MNCQDSVRRPSSPWLVSGVEPTAYSFASVPLLENPRTTHAPVKDTSPRKHLHVLNKALDTITLLKAQWDSLPRGEQEQYGEVFHQINGKLQSIVGDGQQVTTRDEWDDFMLL